MVFSRLGQSAALSRRQCMKNVFTRKRPFDHCVRCFATNTIFSGPLSVKGPMDCALTGTSLLRSPYFNKGSAFPAEERKAFDLENLLPSSLQTLDSQVRRAYRQFSSRADALAKNVFLASMKDQNEVLYYALISRHIKEMFRIIYTPTQGDAIQQFSEIFRRPAGCFLNIEQPENIDSALARWGSPDDIDIILVTDGEAILGIGDQGVGGILIASAKLAVYTLCAGIHPHRVLPVVLDVGTNNERLLGDDLYLGLRRSRVQGQRYDDFLGKFVGSVRKNFPKALLHFEDFGLGNAARLLEEHRDKFAVFNDDIQGTGCTALAALKAAAKVIQQDIKDLRILCFGAGSAGMGNAIQIAKGIAVEANISMEEARRRIWCIDRAGLLLRSHGDKLTPAQRAFARDDSEWISKDHETLTALIREIKPHVLIGCSTKGGAFTEEAIREMSQHVDRPIVFPLSNPTRLAEADPKDINAWTNGRALIATGSPFPPVEWKGVKYVVAECNNSVIFPAIGLGTVLSRSRLLSDEMLVAATEALASHSPALKDPNNGLLPGVTHVRELSVSIAMAVVKKSVEQGLNQESDIPSDDSKLETWIRDQMWDAEYRPLRRVSTQMADKHAKGQMGTEGTVTESR